MPVSNKRMIVLRMIVFDMALGWILPEKLGAAVLLASQNILMTKICDFAYLTAGLYCQATKNKNRNHLIN